MIAPDWWDKLNDPQRESVQKLIPVLWAAHYTDIIVRVNGEDRRYQGDWLKHLFPRPDRRGQ